jgi:hypothetical protein
MKISKNVIPAIHLVNVDSTVAVVSSIDITPPQEIILPNGSRFSRLAGCAITGSVYNKR